MAKIKPPKVFNRPGATVEDARIWLNENIYKEGCICPVCKGHAKVYTRTLNGVLAYCLCRVYVQFRRSWCHFSKYAIKERLPASRNNFTLLRFWGFIEPQEGIRDDGCKRIGIWRITDKGERFVRNRLQVENQIIEYKNKLLGVSNKSIRRFCQDIMRDKRFIEQYGFRYEEIMKPVFKQLRLF